MCGASHSQTLRSIPGLIATCRCERSAAISLRGILGVGLFLLGVASTADATYSGGSGTAQDPYQIATAADLMALGETPGDYDKHFILTADIDLDPNLPGRKVFDKAVIAPASATEIHPYAQGTPFTGVFDGNGHTISHLTITGKDCLGLFGQLGSGAEVKNLGVVAVSITGSGEFEWVGGLVGGNDGTVTQCYSTGAVSGGSSVGGLVGSNSGTMTQCYSTGAVTGKNYVGGLVGANSWDQEEGVSGSVTHCYTTGAVTGENYVGGLVGYNPASGSLTQCYSTGVVSATGGYVGGLVGSNDGTALVTACFWDTQTSHQVTSAGGTGKTTAEMQTAKTYVDAGWDFVGETENGTHEVWQMPAGGGYPVLAILSGYVPPPLHGLGSPEDPYLISNARELGAMVHYSPSAHYRLAASLDLLGIRWGTAVIPAFSGTFDGNGHAISHLTIRGRDDLGLFGILESGAEVKDLGVVDVSITGSGNLVGGLVGSNYGTVTRCYCTGVVCAGDGVGGLVGHNQGTVADSYSTALVSSFSLVSGFLGVGGLVGSNYGAVTQCYSTGAVSGDFDVGGLVGGNWWGRLTQCYSTGAVSGTARSVGGLVGRNNLGNVSQCFWDSQTSHQVTSDGGTGLSTAQMHDPNTFRAAGWDSVGPADGPSDIWAMPAGGGYPILWWQQSPLPSLPGFSGGTGGPNDPYVISTAKDLNRIGHNPRLMKCHFRLGADLDLAGLRFYPIGDGGHPYGGVFDGNAHMVSHLTITGKDDVGMFGYLASGAEVEDLGVVDVNITASGHYVGGLVAWNYGGTVTQCYSTGTVSGSGYYVGGLVGWNDGGIVTRCYSTGGVSGDYGVGGLVGRNEGTVTQCYSTGAVHGDKDVGGLVGCNYGGTVTECYSTGAVSSAGSDVGGLVGSNGGDGGNVTECYSTGAVSSAGPHVGGIVGYNYGTGTVIQCYSTGAVSGTGGVGGLVGDNWGTVTQCYSTGGVAGTGQYGSVGGLVGDNGGTVTQCYSTGVVAGGGQYIGGLVGATYQATVTACFWDTQTSGQKVSNGGTGKTTAQMQTAKTFLDAGWDFVGETANGTADIWWILEGKDYPRLWWELPPAK